MHFERIPKTKPKEFSGYIDDPDGFYRFADEFNIVGVHWSQPTTLTATYFLRLLVEGSSARARIYGDTWWKTNDEQSNEMHEYYTPLLDHGAMWRMANGTVICTAMPYGTVESIEESFQCMKAEYNYPNSIHMQFLNNKYRYRPNGDYMIIIYHDSSEELFDPYCSYEELRIKATQHSAPGKLRYQECTSSYVRDRYVSEYAKRRANGFCQLCDQPAPFFDNNGDPYLETHHVIWLAEGGSDSIKNTVALCPNCHRKMHSLNLETDVNKLLRVAESMD